MLVCPFQAYSSVFCLLHLPAFKQAWVSLSHNHSLFNPFTPHSISVFELFHVQTSLNASVPEVASRPFADLTSFPRSFEHQRPSSGNSRPSALSLGDGPLPRLDAGAPFLLRTGFSPPSAPLGLRAACPGGGRPLLPLASIFWPLRHVPPLRILTGTPGRLRVSTWTMSGHLALPILLLLCVEPPSILVARPKSLS